jgi:hypothetical protein
MGEGDGHQAAANRARAGPNEYERKRADEFGH